MEGQFDVAVAESRAKQVDEWSSRCRRLDPRGRRADPAQRDQAASRRCRGGEAPRGGSRARPPARAHRFSSSVPPDHPVAEATRARQQHHRGSLRCPSAMPSSSARTGSASTTSRPTPPRSPSTPRSSSAARRGTPPKTTTCRARFTEARGGLEQTFAGLVSRRRRARPQDRSAQAPRRAHLRPRLPHRRVRPRPRRPASPGSPPGPHRTRPRSSSSSATAAETRRRPRRQGRPHPRHAYITDDDTEITSVSRLLSDLFVRDEAPRFALVLAGRGPSSPSRSAGPRGATSPSNLQLVAERNDTQARPVRSTAPSPSSRRTPSVPTRTATSGGLRSSTTRSSTPLGVSKDLREGVRLSIEIIANEVVRRRPRQGLEPLAAGPGAATGDPVAALPLPDPLPPLRRGLPGARRCSRSAPRSTTRATASTASAT